MPLAAANNLLKDIIILCIISFFKWLTHFKGFFNDSNGKACWIYILVPSVGDIYKLSATSFVLNNLKINVYNWQPFYRFVLGIYLDVSETCFVKCILVKTDWRNHKVKIWRVKILISPVWYNLDFKLWQNQRVRWWLPTLYENKLGFDNFHFINFESNELAQ